MLMSSCGLALPCRTATAQALTTYTIVGDAIPQSSRARGLCCAGDAALVFDRRAILASSVTADRFRNRSSRAISRPVSVWRGGSWSEVSYGCGWRLPPSQSHNHHAPIIENRRIGSRQTAWRGKPYCRPGRSRKVIISQRYVNRKAAAMRRPADKHAPPFPRPRRRRGCAGRGSNRGR